jgi:NAD(P)-dependent dehydrogenase (short-subunit alcohol dehydrogenase family)
LTGEAAAEAIRASGGRATFIQTDVTDDSQVADLAKLAAAAGDGIDIWFNNAGIEGGLGPLSAFDDRTVRNAETGELLRELVLNPDRDYQPTGRPSGWPKKTPLT